MEETIVTFDDMIRSERRKSILQILLPNNCPITHINSWDTTVTDQKIFFYSENGCALNVAYSRAGLL